MEVDINCGSLRVPPGGLPWRWRDSWWRCRLRLGIMGWGHAVMIPDPAGAAPRRKGHGHLVGVRDLLQDMFAGRHRSAGGTGTYDVTGAYPGVTEAGACAIHGRPVRHRGGGLSALTVARVISAAEDMVVIDAGRDNDRRFGLPTLVHPRWALQASRRSMALRREASRCGRVMWSRRSFARLHRQ